MPLTALDPRSALICVDLQHGVLGLPTAHDAQEIADRAGGLAEAFRRSGRPVVLVNVAGIAPGRTDAGPVELTTIPAAIEVNLSHV